MDDEYVQGHEWRHKPHSEQLATVELPYHDRDLNKAARQLVLLANIHLHILSGLDECLDGRLGRDAEWERQRAVAHVSTDQLDKTDR